MNILMTGNEGFIGTRLQKRLEDKGHTVDGIDLKSDKDILTCDLTQYNPDLVIHLAGRSGVRESFKDPSAYWFNNVDGTRRIFEHFKDKRILYASSSSAHEPTRNPYAASKYIMDMIASEMKICGVGMRFHTVYDEIPRPNMFLDKLLNGTLEYVTEHTRDFVHLDDVVDAIEILIDSDYNGIIDIGTGKEVTVKDYAPDLPIKTDTPLERQRTCADTTEIKKLGWEPKYDFDKFVREKIYKSHIPQDDDWGTI